MELQFIKETECPKCRCTIIESESIEVDVFAKHIKYRQHVNGERWENRIFACGQKLSYSPNCNKTELSNYSTCKQDESYLIEMKNKK